MRIHIHLYYKEKTIQTTIIDVYPLDAPSASRRIDITRVVDRFCEIERHRALPAEHHREDLDRLPPAA